jgi:hypothetical protein
MVMAVMETPHRLAGSLRQNITQVQSPSVFVGIGFVGDGFGGPPKIKNLKQIKSQSQSKPPFN